MNSLPAFARRQQNDFASVGHRLSSSPRPRRLPLVNYAAGKASPHVKYDRWIGSPAPKQSLSDERKLLEAPPSPARGFFFRRRLRSAHPASPPASVAPISHRARIRELSPLFTRRVVIPALAQFPEFIDPVWPREISPLSGLSFWLACFALHSDDQDTL